MTPEQKAQKNALLIALREFRTRLEKITPGEWTVQTGPVDMPEISGYDLDDLWNAYDEMAAQIHHLK